MLAIAVDDVVVDGVVYTWDSDLSGYVASGCDRTTPITHLRILNEVNEMNVVAVGDDYKGIVIVGSKKNVTR